MHFKNMYQIYIYVYLLHIFEMHLNIIKCIYASNSNKVTSSSF